MQAKYRQHIKWCTIMLARNSFWPYTSCH